MSMPQPRELVILLVAAIIGQAACQDHRSTLSTPLEFPPEAIVPAADIGRLPGSLNVSATGAATYRIPIDVPAGRNGMQPELALSYNSRSGNGSLGVGWEVAGLSKITRCPPSLAFGGRTGGISFNGFPQPAALDQFCLDGKPLVAVEGKYGANGTEYRTVPDTQARIISQGALGGAPASFKVYDRHGRIAHYTDLIAAGRVYSHALDGTLSVSSAQAIYGWAITLLQDRSGNSMTVAWARETDASDSMAFEHVPLSIHYSYPTPGDPIGTPQRKVQFDYEARPDPIDAYISGFHFRTTRRLRSISTFAPYPGAMGKLTHQYKLEYETGATTDRSLLRRVTKCDSNGACLPATKLAWDHGSYLHGEAIEIGAVTNDLRFRTGDVNGDGKDDILYEDTTLPKEAGGWWVLLSTGTNFEAPRRIEGTAWYENVVGLIDHDRDSTADVLVGDSLYRWTGDSFAPAQGYMESGKQPKVGDIDGNGTPDLFVRVNDPTSEFHGAWKWRKNVHGSPMSPFQPAALTGFGEDASEYVSPSGTMIRLLGNGASQLLFDPGKNKGAYRFLFSSGGSIDAGNTNLLARWGFHVFLDVNGDGLDDVLDNYDGTIRINTGWGFGPPYPADPDGWSKPDQLVPGQYWSHQSESGARVVDLNNDGRMDVARIVQGKGSACISNGRTLDCSWYPLLDIDVEDPPTNRTFPAGFLDVNGDGLMDVIAARGGVLRVYLRTGEMADRLSRVTVGTGASESVGYTTTADPTAYMPGPRCGYPQWCNPRRIQVVKRIGRERGDGAENDELYSYVDARYDVRGQGFLGFGRVRKDEPVHNRTSERTYSVLPAIDGRYSRLGLPTRQTTFQRIAADRVRVETTKIKNQGWSPATGTYFARPVHEIGEDYEWTNPGGIAAPGLDQPLESAVAGMTPYRTTRVDRRFDGYANLLERVRSTDGGTTTKEIFEYDIRPAEWLVALRSREIQTSVGENGETDTFEITYAHDALGRLALRTIEPMRATLTRYTKYDRAVDGLVTKISEWGPSDAIREMGVTYDTERIHHASVTNPVGHKTSVLIHPALGVLIAMADLNGAETTFTYDTFGRQRGRIEAGGRKTKIDHIATPSGYLVHVKDNTGVSHVREVDVLERPIMSSRFLDGRWSVITNTYDDAGRLSSYRMPAFAGEPAHTVTRTLDGMGRIVRVDYPDGSNEVTRYGAQTVYTWDRAGDYRFIETNVDGALSRSVDHIDGSDVATTYTYGAFGRLAQVTDATGTVVDDVHHDSLGRRARIVDADAGTIETTFNAFGEVRSETNALGAITRYQRDLLGRVVRRTDVDGATRYSWDSAITAGEPIRGALGHAASPDGAVTWFGYDTLGRLRSRKVIAGGAAYEIGQQYDSVGRLSLVSYPSTPGGNVEITYTYASDGALEGVLRGGTMLWKAQDHDAFGHITHEQLGNGALIARTYKPATGRLRDIESYVLVPDGSGAVDKKQLQHLSYTHYADGNPSSRTDHIKGINEKFTYDDADRLVAWSQAGASGIHSFELTYDEVGNMTRSVGPDGTHTFEHGVGAGPHAVTSVNGLPLTYDAAGRRSSGPGATITYTPFDLPRAITTGAGTTVFGYDAFGARVTKQSPTGATTYVGGLYEHRTGAEESHHFYVRAANRVVAEVVETAGTQDIRYLHPDHLGSTQVLTDDAANVVDRRWYTPFGQLTTAVPTGGGGHTGGFTGHEADFAERLVNMQGRIYDPATRRFLTPDPIIGRAHLGQNFNRYAYVLNAPLTLVDPTGLYDEIPDDSCGQCDFEDDYVTVDRTQDYAPTWDSEPDFGDYEPDYDPGYDPNSGYQDSDDHGYNDTYGNSGGGQQPPASAPSNEFYRPVFWAGVRTTQESPLSPDILSRGAAVFARGGGDSPFVSEAVTTRSTARADSAASHYRDALSDLLGPSLGGFLGDILASEPNTSTAIMAEVGVMPGGVSFNAVTLRVSLPILPAMWGRVEVVYPVDGGLMLRAGPQTGHSDAIGVTYEETSVHY